MNFHFKINQKRFESSESKLTGQQLLEIAELLPTEDYELLQRVNEDGYKPIQLTEEVDLKEAGIEGFVARPYKKLLIKVDDNSIEVEECFMTPIEIMSEAGIDSDRYYLKEIRKKGVEVSYIDDVEHKVAISNKSCFVSCLIEEVTCIIINARPKPWNKNTISFEELVRLQYGQVNGPGVIHTVTYKGGVPSNAEGSMVAGETISVKNKMIFNVTQTNKS